MTIIKRRLRNPRLGEAVFIWTGQRLEPGRVVRIDASQSRAPVFPHELLRFGEHLPEAGMPTTNPVQSPIYTMERFHIHLIDRDVMMVCGREDFALLPDLRHLIPRMGRAPQAV